MKTLSRLNLFLLTAVAIAAVSCKGKSGSGNSSSASPSSGAEAAAASKGNSVMDSLNLTDPDEKKVCGLYDQAVTDYLTNWKTLTTDTSKAADQKRKDLDEKWKEKSKEMQPQVEALRTKFVANPSEAIKFSQFWSYEAKRVMGPMLDYEKNMLKNMPASAPAGK